MAELQSLQDVLKDINKKFGDNTARVGVDELTASGTLSFGSPSLDFCVYNHLVEGKMYEFNGLESSGKTTVAFLVASSYIKKELERNPENPRKILFVDVECAADPNWALEATGYNMNSTNVETICITPAGQSAEEIFSMILRLAKTGEIGLIIIDSLSMLVSDKLMDDDTMEQKEMGGIAVSLKYFCNKIAGVLNKYKTTLIGINGLSDNMSGYGDPWVTPGGKAWKRACMGRFRFKQGDFFDEDGNILAKKDAQSPAGHIIEMYVMKTKICKWDRKLGMLHLNYSRGVDLLQDTIDVATFFGLIDNSTQGTFKVLDPDTGEVMLDNEGKEIKIRGKKNVKPYFEENLWLWDKLYKKVYEMLSKRDDPNIVAFEKMLGLNLSERVGQNMNIMEE